MRRENINASADENNNSALIEELKQRLIEKRVLAYITKVIRNSPFGCCFVSQAVIRRALRIRKQSVTDACRNITDRGELIRIPADNKNRENPKHYYFLPDSTAIAELCGNSIKSSFSNNKEQENEESRVPPKSIQPERTEAAEVEAVRIDSAANFSEVKSWINSDKISLIEKYLNAGLMVTPLIERGKIPPSGWSKKYLRTLSKDELLNYFRENPQANVGCWMPENLVVVDADDLDGFYRITNGETWETLTVSSGRSEGGLHLWFRHEGTIGSSTGIRSDLDYKSTGSLVVLPPSVHKSGAVYQWSNLAAPIDAPTLIQELYDTRQNLKNGAVTELFENAKKGFFPFITAESVIPQGQRYDQLFRLGRYLKHRMNTEQVTAELDRYNWLCCQPPLDEKRMNKLVRDVLFGADRKDFRKS